MTEINFGDSGDEDIVGPFEEGDTEVGDSEAGSPEGFTGGSVFPDERDPDWFDETYC